MKQAQQPLHSGSTDTSVEHVMSPSRKADETKVIILAGACTSCLVLGVASVMPMIPMLARNFDIPLSLAVMVIMAFTLPGIIFTPLAGILADKYGRKRVLIPAVLLFAFAGGGCFFAPNFTALIVLRLLQGIAGAPLGILNTTILGDSFSGNRLTRVLGYNMAVLSTCTALYPAIGGFLGEFGWQFPFLLPWLSLPCLYLIMRAPLKGPGENLPLRDYVRSLQKAIANPYITRLLGITFLTFAMLYGPIITCLPPLLDKRFAASPALIGSLMMLYSIGAGVMSAQLGNLAQHFSQQRILFASQCCYIIALIAIPLMTDILYLIPFLMCYGIGQGMNIPSIQMALMHNVKAEARASVMAMNGTLLRCGQTVSPILFGVMTDSFGVNSAFWVAIVIPLIILSLIYTLPSHSSTKP